MIKYLDFVENLNDDTILMGFKANQIDNITKNAGVNGKTITAINVDKNGLIANKKVGNLKNEPST